MDNGNRGSMNYDKTKEDFFKLRNVLSGTDSSEIWEELNKIQKEKEELNRKEKQWRTALIVVGNNKLREAL